MKGDLNMSNKAYDTKKDEEVYAADCISAEKGRYICPFCFDKGKAVPVYLRKTDGEKTFVSYEVCDHIKGCNFPTAQEYKNAYSPVFDRYTLLDRIEMPSKDKKSEKSHQIISSNNKLHHSKRPTLKWLYNVCIANDNSHTFAEGCTVENSCLKQGTLKYWYNKDKTQYPLLIIGQIKGFYKGNHSLLLSIGNYKINVIFENDNRFCKFISECFKHNGQTVGTAIYLYGQLSNSEKLQTVTIISCKQIDIVP